jgi:hypothetical protein
MRIKIENKLLLQRKAGLLIGLLLSRLDFERHLTGIQIERIIVLRAENIAFRNK